MGYANLIVDAARPQYNEALSYRGAVLYRLSGIIRKKGVITRSRVLANSCAAALDKKQQYDDHKNSTNNANNGYVVHITSPFLLV